MTMPSSGSCWYTHTRALSLLSAVCVCVFAFPHISLSDREVCRKIDTTSMFNDVCVQVLEAVRTATLRHTKQGQTCCPELSALRGGPRGRGGEPAVEFARGSADALRVARHDGGREAGEVVWQVLLRRGTAEAVI